MTQLDQVKQIIDQTGEISRNTCLKLYITRLGALICVLKKQGYNFESGYRGGDYVYKVKKMDYEELENIDLNAELTKLYKSIKPTWENQPKLTEIQKALKSKSEFLKKQTIIKYK